MAVFQLEQVRYRHILKADALTLSQDFICITGSSGGGKTTLLKLLNKLYAPDTGRILLDGEDLAALDTVAVRRRVAMLGQTVAVYGQTVRDNLLVVERFTHKKHLREDQLRAAVQAACLDKGLDEPVSAFSGGEKQRLALARVLLLESDVLLLDEPTAALDEPTAHEVLGNLTSVCTATGRQLILVTHSPALAGAYHPRMILVENGVVKGGKTDG